MLVEAGISRGSVNASELCLCLQRGACHEGKEMGFLERRCNHLEAGGSSAEMLSQL